MGRNVETEKDRNFADYIAETFGYLTLFVMLWIFFISKIFVVKNESTYLIAEFIETYFNKHRSGHSMGVLIRIDKEIQRIGYENTDLSWALKDRKGEVLKFYLFTDYTYFKSMKYTWKVETLDGKLLYEN
jgi:hypothetical protein